MENNQIIRDGQKVTGVYCGVKYSGEVSASRANQARRAQIIYTVVLDEHINVYGRRTNRIFVESDCDTNQIAAAKI